MSSEPSRADLDKSFAVGCGKRMRQVRERAGRSQEEVAEALGYSTASVSGWERGSREPSLRAIANLARYLETDVSAFFPSADAGWDAPVETPAQRLTRVERQVKTVRGEQYVTADRLAAVERLLSAEFGVTIAEQPA